MKIKVISGNGERTRYGEVLYKVYGKNGCCKNIPFLVVKNNDGAFECGKPIDVKGGYACECECGMWNTSAYEDPISPVLEYLQMSGVKL